MASRLAKVRDFVLSLQADRNVKEPTDWYKVNRTVISKRGGNELLAEYGGSISKMLHDVYPNHIWHEWLFPVVPKSYWSDIKHQKAFLEWFMSENGLTSLDQWYGVSQRDFKQQGGGSVLALYGESLINILRSIFPDHEWVEWGFSHVPNGFWNTIENQRKYFDWLERKLNITDKTQWYNTNPSKISQHSGITLIHKLYRGSLPNCLKTVYPEHDWVEWKFRTGVPLGFWRSQKNQRRFLLWLEKELNLTSRNCWYGVSKLDVVRHGGTTLIHHIYAGSLQAALRAAFPEHTWRGWMFDNVARNYWNNPNNQKEFLEYVKEEMGVSEVADWYKVTSDDIKRLGGRAMLARYHESLPSALQALFPDHDWDPIRFQSYRTPKQIEEAQSTSSTEDSTPERGIKPPGYWSDITNQRAFFDDAEIKLGIVQKKDWYHVTSADIERLHGMGILSTYYQYLLSQALKAVYPEHEWHEWLFSSVPTKFFEDSSNQLRYMKWIEGLLDITSLDQWYNIDPKTVQQHGGWSLMKVHNNSFIALLRAVFPHHTWQPWRFKHSPKRTWRDPATVREFCDWFAAQKGIKGLEEWYDVDFSELNQLGGGGLCKLYKSSLFALIKDAYPEHEWLPWNFKKTPRLFWGSEENRRYFFEWLGKQLQYKDPADWYQISSADVARYGGASMLRRFYKSSLQHAIPSVFPEHRWESFKFESPSANVLDS